MISSFRRGSLDSLGTCNPEAIQNLTERGKGNDNGLPLF